MSEDSSDGLTAARTGVDVAVNNHFTVCARQNPRYSMVSFQHQRFLRKGLFACKSGSQVDFGHLEPAGSTNDLRQFQEGNSNRRVKQCSQRLGQCSVSVRILRSTDRCRSQSKSRSLQGQIGRGRSSDDGRERIPTSGLKQKCAQMLRTVGWQRLTLQCAVGSLVIF
jgi:hypothetical protein